MGYHPGTFKTKPHKYLVSYEYSNRTYTISMPYELSIGDILGFYDGYYEVVRIRKGYVQVKRSTRRVIQPKVLEVKG